MATQSQPLGYYNGNQTSYRTTPTIKYCFGNGYQGTIGLRYGIKKSFGLELGVGYLVGSTSRANNTYVIASIPEVNAQRTDKFEGKARIVRYNFGFSIVGRKKLSVTARGGLTLATGKVIVNNNSEVTSTSASTDTTIPFPTTQTTTTERTVKYYGGASLGVYCSAGANYKINDNFAVNLSLDAIIQNFSPKKATLTKYAYNGDNILIGLPTSLTETVFKIDPKPVASLGKPQEAQKISMPLSSFGPSLRITYSFGKKE
jgi:hypothetical protein